MGNFITNPHHIENNLVYSNDKNIWAVYTLTAPTISTSSIEMIEAAQNTSASLLYTLAKLPMKEATLAGFKGMLTPEQLYTPILESVKNYSPDTHASLANNIIQMSEEAQHNPLFHSYKRLWVLAVCYPKIEDAYMVGVFKKLFGKDNFNFASPKKIREWEKNIFTSIPPELQPARASGNVFEFIHNRTIDRGVSPTEFPNGNDSILSQAGFTPAKITFATDMKAWQEDFVDEMVAHEWEKKEAAKAYKNQWGGVLHGNCVAVRNMGAQTSSTPGGLVSYQTGMMVMKYPTTPSYNIYAFTGIVDHIGVDADIVFRFTFPKDLLDPERNEKFSKSVGRTDSDVSESLFESSRYSRILREQNSFFFTAQEESSSVALSVSTMYMLGDTNLLRLQKQADMLHQQMGQQGFNVLQVLGGQGEVLLSGVPGAYTGGVVNAGASVSTVMQFAPCVPLRQYYHGAEHGFPIAFNRDSVLGGWVYYDFLNAATSGGGSLLYTGAKGSGKSYAQKMNLGLLHDAHVVTHIIDQSTNGEYEVFAHSLSQCQTVNVVDGNYSLDIFKCFPPDVAKEIFANLFLPLLGVDEKSAAAAKIMHWVDPKVRQTYGITSLRKLSDILWSQYKNDGENADTFRAANALRFFGTLPVAKCVIDPIDATGRAVNIPPLKFTSSIVVFRTHRIPVPKDDGVLSAAEKFGGLIYNLIAYLTSYRFNKISTPCCLMGDEMYFLKDSPVLKDLIENTDRQGRRANNFIISASQVAEDFGDEYRLVSKRIALKQENIKNAASAVKWLDVKDEGDVLTQELLYDTSPIDPATGMPQVGREGEGWFRDGQHVTRIQMMPMLGGRDAGANTHINRNK